jgi:hypothetical protein
VGEKNSPGENSLTRSGRTMSPSNHRFDGNLERTWKVSSLETRRMKQVCLGTNRLQLPYCYSATGGRLPAHTDRWKSLEID